MAHAGAIDTPLDTTPLASGTNTPHLESDTRHIVGTILGGGDAPQIEKEWKPAKEMTVAAYDSDIDPDDLLPVYLETKTQLFELQSSPTKGDLLRVNGHSSHHTSPLKPLADPEEAKLVRKIKRIEDDVLFDKYLATRQWELRRIQLEKEAAARRHGNAKESAKYQEIRTLVDSDNEVSQEAAQIGTSLLEETGSDDDTVLADLFASLPISEVDPLTGKSTIVINGSNGIKVTIRDFGKWTGISPVRVLEEACRSR